MILMQSQKSRRFIGRLDPGAELISSLQSICTDNAVRCAEIRATGFLKNVVLEVFHHGQRKYRPLVLGPTSYQLTSFMGNVSSLGDRTAVHIHATLLPDLGTGETTLAGGRLMQADVVALEFTIDTIDDFTLERKLDDNTGFEQWVNLEMDSGKTVSVELPSADSPAIPEGPAIATKVAVTPEEIEDDEEEEEEEDSLELMPGDILDHPRLQRCEVVNSDGERALIKLQSGRSAELHLSVIALQLKEDPPGGPRVFSVQVRRRG